MPGHNWYRVLARRSPSIWPSVGQTEYVTGAGYQRGWGTTVGSGIQGWAAGATFLVYASDGTARRYTNYGDANYAVWFDDDTLFQYRRQSTFFDDFFPSAAVPGDTSTVMTYNSTDDGGTNAFIDTSSFGMIGVFRVVTGGSDDNYHLMSTPLKMSDVGPAMWFEARVRLVEANVDDANWVVGISSVVTDGFLTAAGGGPPATYDGIVFYKVDGGSSIMCAGGKATVHTSLTASTWTSNTWYRLAFHYQSLTTRVYVNGVYVGALVVPASSDNLYIIFGAKAGGDNAESFDVDYIGQIMGRG